MEQGELLSVIVLVFYRMKDLSANPGGGGFEHNPLICLAQGHWQHEETSSRLIIWTAALNRMPLLSLDIPSNMITCDGNSNAPALSNTGYVSVVKRRLILHGNAAVSLMGSGIGQQQLTAPSTHISYLPNYYHQVSGEWRLCCCCRCRCCCCCPRCGGGEKASLFVQRSSGLPCLPASIDTATSEDKNILSEDRGRLFICRIHLCSI